MAALFRSAKKAQANGRFAIGLAMSFVIICTFAFLVLVAKIRIENALRMESQNAMVQRLAMLEEHLSYISEKADPKAANTQVKTAASLDQSAMSVKLGENALDSLGNAVKFVKLGLSGSIRLEGKGIAPGSKLGDVVLLPGACSKLSTFAVTYESLSLDASGTVAKLVTSSVCP